MKKSILIGALVAGSLAVTSCDDFLDDNRYPTTEETDNPVYWNNVDNIKLQCDQMLSYFPGYATGSSYGEFYFNTLTDDQCFGLRLEIHQRFLVERQLYHPTKISATQPPSSTGLKDLPSMKTSRPTGWV